MSFCPIVPVSKLQTEFYKIRHLDYLLVYFYYILVCGKWTKLHGLRTVMFKK